MKVKAIAAIGEDNAIGKENHLLWHLPNDLAFLKQNIQDCWLVSGRKSFESAQGVEIFENREDVIVVTSNKEYRLEKGLVAHSIDEVRRIAAEQQMDCLCVLGGATIYEAMMDDTDELIITRVHAVFPEADTYFPEIDLWIWEVVSEDFHRKDESHDFDYSFVIYRRKEAK